MLMPSGVLVRREGYPKVLAVALAALFTAFIILAGLQPG